MMKQRLDYTSAAPEAVRPLLAAGAYLSHTTLEPVLRVFVELRASQINGCAFCIAMHSREAVELGETGDRLWGLPAWREASWYSSRERAALEWTEVLTRISDGHPSDECYARVRAAFDDKEVVALTLAITVINAWNRFGIAFGTPPESADDVLRQLRKPTAR